MTWFKSNPIPEIARNYSTTEHIIGKWIDGKDLYEITYANTGNPSIDISGLNIDTVVGIDSAGTYGVRSDNSDIISMNYLNPTSTSYGWGWAVGSNKASLYVSKTSNFNIASYAVTLRYTKVTT